MDWARIMVPLNGGDDDGRSLKAGAKVAGLFGAELAAIYTPPDISDLMPWVGDGYMGGIQPAALDSLREAAAAGEAAARSRVAACGYDRTAFVALSAPVWASLAMEGRLSDIVVFDDHPARGRGALAPVFQQIVADEQRPTLVARGDFRPDGVVAVAWDGGKEASRAVRTALPLLQKARSVTILNAPAASPRKSDPAALQAFLAVRGVEAGIVRVAGGGEPAPALLREAKALSADLLVAGAFGHPRLQEFIFGGATRSFLHAEAPSLFISH
ncbi:MAG: universal stress protein [Alphaproteobacteria bacterium]|nr:universal stress protein [Alphaproteobacteria bacterium]